MSWPSTIIGTARQIGRAVILVIMYVVTFKNDIFVFISNIMCLTSHFFQYQTEWVDTDNIRLSELILTISDWVSWYWEYHSVRSRIKCLNYWQWSILLTDTVVYDVKSTYAICTTRTPNIGICNFKRTRRLIFTHVCDPMYVSMITLSVCVTNIVNNDIGVGRTDKTNISIVAGFFTITWQWGCLSL
jgi:hypothetical protein